MSPGRTEHPYGRSAEQMRRRTDRERRLRRVRATQLIVFSILVIGLFVAAWYAWTQLREASSPAPSSTTAEETTPEGPWCPEDGAVPADPSEVEVSVLNGTSTTGLAGSVSGELVERGFVAGEVGNTGRAAPGVTILYAEQDYLAARAVAVQFTADRVSLQTAEDGEDPAAMVTVLLGEGSSSNDLREAGDAAEALTEPVDPPEGCSPS